MQVSGCSNRFRPESYRYVGIPHHTSCLCIEGSYHPFRSSVFVLGVWGGGFVGNSFFGKYTQKDRVVEFS